MLFDFGVTGAEGMTNAKAASVVWALTAIISFTLNEITMVHLSIVCMSIFAAADEIISHIDEGVK